MVLSRGAPDPDPDPVDPAGSRFFLDPADPAGSRLDPARSAGSRICIYNVCTLDI